MTSPAPDTTRIPGPVLVALEHEGFDFGRQVDPDRVARAVEELLLALAPTLHPRVRVHAVRPEPGRDPRPRPGSGTLTAVPDDDGLHLDLDGRTLTVDGRPVALTRREFDLLAFLHQRRGTALSRRELMTSVWQSGYLDGDRTVDVHVRRVRMKLGRHADRLSTLRGFGYRLD